MPCYCGRGGNMSCANAVIRFSAASLIWAVAFSALAQSFRVQCPTSTITHPTAANNNSEPAYAGATTFAIGPNGYMKPTGNVNGAIKCQQMSGGDGYVTMGDGTQ